MPGDLGDDDEILAVADELVEHALRADRANGGRSPHPLAQQPP
jgi:hypothetical protein